jgi:hypothetical protein
MERKVLRRIQSPLLRAAAESCFVTPVFIQTNLECRRQPKYISLQRRVCGQPESLDQGVENFLSSGLRIV